MILWRYILLFTCLGIGVALCVGAISILRSPPDHGPPAWFAAAFGAMFLWGAFALARWRAGGTNNVHKEGPIICPEPHRAIADLVRYWPLADIAFCSANVCSAFLNSS
jgi:hypothetical protein